MEFIVSRKNNSFKFWSWEMNLLVAREKFTLFGIYFQNVFYMFNSFL